MAELRRIRYTSLILCLQQAICIVIHNNTDNIAYLDGLLRLQNGTESQLEPYC